MQKISFATLIIGCLLGTPSIAQQPSYPYFVQNNTAIHICVWNIVNEYTKVQIGCIAPQEKLPIGRFQFPLTIMTVPSDPIQNYVIHDPGCYWVAFAGKFYSEHVSCNWKSKPKVPPKSMTGG